MHDTMGRDGASGLASTVRARSVAATGASVVPQNALSSSRSSQSSAFHRQYLARETTAAIDSDYADAQMATVMNCEVELPRLLLG